MSENVAPEVIDEKKSLKNELDLANERYSDLEKRISLYISHLEPFEVKEGKEDDWKDIAEKNQGDDYSEAWFNYTDHWARLMQILIKNKVIMTEDLISECHFLADTYGITGFMHEAAVAALKKYWKYGDIFETGTKNTPIDPLERLEKYADDLQNAGMAGYAMSIRECVKEIRWDKS